MALGPHSVSESVVLEKHAGATAAPRLAVTLVTPAGSVRAGDVDEIIAPGVEGELGVLPGHVPFITALKPGVLTLRDAARRDVYAVGGGYLQVGIGGATRVLVQMALAAADIDVAEARNDRAEAEEQLKATAGQSLGEQTPLRGRLAWAQARLDAKVAAGQRAG